MKIFLYALLLSPIVALLIAIIKKEKGWLAVLDFFLYAFGLAVVFEIIAAMIILSYLKPGGS